MAEEKTLENKILMYLTVALVIAGCFIIYKDVFLRSKVYIPFLPD